MKLDATELEVRSILLNEAWHAHGFHRTNDDKDACPKCRGDGCHACFWTGLVKS